VLSRRFTSVGTVVGADKPGGHLALEAGQVIGSAPTASESRCNSPVFPKGPAAPTRRTYPSSLQRIERVCNDRMYPTPWFCCCAERRLRADEDRVAAISDFNTPN